MTPVHLTCSVRISCYTHSFSRFCILQLLHSRIVFLEKMCLFELTSRTLHYLQTVFADLANVHQHLRSHNNLVHWFLALLQYHEFNDRERHQLSKSTTNACFFTFSSGKWTNFAWYMWCLYYFSVDDSLYFRHSFSIRERSSHLAYSEQKK